MFNSFSPDFLLNSYFLNLAPIKNLLFLLF